MQPSPAPPPPSETPSPRRLPILVIALIAFLGLAVLVGVPLVFSGLARYAQRSKTTEAISNLAVLCEHIRDASAASGALPPSVSRTPPQVPGPIRVGDLPAVWNQPGWQALSFAVTTPHYYSYEYSSSADTFIVRAIGDLDGDGVQSTFERAGRFVPGQGATCGPLRATNELE